MVFNPETKSTFAERQIKIEFSQIASNNCTNSIRKSRMHVEHALNVLHHMCTILFLSVFVFVVVVAVLRFSRASKTTQKYNAYSKLNPTENKLRKLNVLLVYIGWRVYVYILCVFSFG